MRSDFNDIRVNLEVVSNQAAALHRAYEVLSDDMDMALALGLQKEYEDILPARNAVLQAQERFREENASLLSALNLA